MHACIDRALFLTFSMYVITIVVLKDYNSEDIEIKEGQTVGLPDKEFVFIKVSIMTAFVL